MRCNVCHSEKLALSIEAVSDCCKPDSLMEGRFFACEMCGTAQVAPWLEPQDLVHAYQGYYTHGKARLPRVFPVLTGYYRRLLAPDKCSKRFHAVTESLLLLPASFMLRRAINFLPPIQRGDNISILEVGCGNGKHLLRYAGLGLSAIGIDPDAGALEAARLQGLAVSDQDISELPDEQYDAVIVSHVVEHVDNPKAFVKELHRVLKPQGYLFISTPNFDSAGRKTFSNAWRGLDFPRHRNIFTDGALTEILSVAGFTIREKKFDFPQSIGIIKSSFSIAKKSLLNIKAWGTLIQNGLFKKKHAEVLVYRCFKK